MSYLSRLADGTVSIRLHVQPKASKSRIVGLHDGCLKLAVAAPPVEGKANKEVVKFLAALLGIPSRDVTVRAGDKSRKKLVVIQALNADAIRLVVEEALSSNRS